MIDKDDITVQMDMENFDQNIETLKDIKGSIIQTNCNKIKTVKE